MTRENRRILIVDDDPCIRQLFHALLSDRYTIRETGSGEEAVVASGCWTPDLVLLDIVMPGMDGYATCLHLKHVKSGSPPQVIMISSHSATEEMRRAFEVGADDYLIKPVCPEELLSRVALHFRLRESQATTTRLQDEVDCHHLTLKRLSEDRLKQITAVQDVAVFTLAKLAESRDTETGQHLLRLREYAQCLARQLRRESPYSHEITDTFLEDLYRSSPLHDVGKVGIPDRILLKAGALTPEEFETMKRHTVMGANVLHDAVMQLKGGSFLAMAVQIAQFHHEHWDGNGYPAGLVGEEIPLSARIVAVADVFDALTSKRHYKQAWVAEIAKCEIEKAAGMQFDPIIVRSFDQCFDEIRQIRNRHSDQDPIVTGANSLLEYDMASL